LSAVSAVAFSLTNSFFSDTETSTANLLQAGELDLLIDNSSYYNGVANGGTSWLSDNLPGHLFFDFLDLKPGDYGEDTISLLVQNPAWACMTITKTSDDDITCNEPELIDDPDCTEPGVGAGELGGLINFAFWADDGDNVYEEGEAIFKTGTASALFDGAVWTLADSASSIWPTPGPIPAEQTRYIGKFWCLGPLTPAALASGDYPGPAADNDANQIPGQPADGGFLCDGTALDNASQTDKLMADVQFTAIQSRHNSAFLCAPQVTPTTTPTPTPLACVETWATTVESTSQGVRKNGTAVLAARSTPSTALVAQTTGTAFDPAPVEGTFYSLGFKNSGATPGGEIIVGFPAPFFNGPGDDLRLFEVTGGPPYPDEKVKVEVGPSNIGPWTEISSSLTKDGTADMGSVVSAQFVRITDISNIALFETTADAYDLDGVRALCATAQ